MKEYYTLEKLAPSYRVFLRTHKKPIDIYSDTEKNKTLFESIEPGAGAKLEDF